MASKLVDKYGRIAKKLRISVTDRCNMRCIYCMPTNNVEWLDDTEVLSFNEIIALAINSYFRHRFFKNISRKLVL